MKKKKKCFEVETKVTAPKYIINVISPKYEYSTYNIFSNELKMTFMNVFELANSLKLKKIGLPLLCTGNYGVKFKILIILLF